MAKKKKRWTEDESSSSSSSSTDDLPTEEARCRRSRSQAQRQRDARKKKSEVIHILTELKEEMRKQSKKLTESKDDTSEIRKQLEKLTESYNDQSKKLEKLTESHSDLCKQLELHTKGTSGDDSAASRSQSNQVQQPRYKLKFTSEVTEKIEKGQSIDISVALVEYNNEDQTVEDEPLASAIVELVVVNAEFNQHDNQYNWSREDFERNIKKARQPNSAAGGVDQSVKSIVSNGRFNLAHGVKSHSGSKIFSNSSNKKVRLGVMVVSPTEERVLEGLSNPFFVRGHDRPNRQAIDEMLASYDFTDQNAMGNNFLGAPGNIGDGLLSSALVGIGTGQNFMGDDHVPFHAIGTEFNTNQTALPVHLILDTPNVELRKRRWDLLEQLMPLYSCQHKSIKSVLPTMRLMSEKTPRRGGVLIEPLEPDDSDERRPLKRMMHNKYRLRFVNKVCETYYTREQIKAYDGNHLKVALFDENNTRITYGPLSSASVEVVALHGDFSVDGDQDYWTWDEFSRGIVCPRPGKEGSVLGGDLILALDDGEACLADAFFQVTSFVARTGKFKMGVKMLASGRQDERIQEGISEAFWVKDRRVGDLPPGFRFQPTDEELIVHYLCKRAAAKPCPIPIVAELDIYQFDPWDLPAKGVNGGEGVWYFFSPSTHKYGNSSRPCRAAGSGYWNVVGTDKDIFSSTADGEVLGMYKTLVFYRGRWPRGQKTTWFMKEYRRLPADGTKVSPSTSSMMTTSIWSSKFGD
ncbi:uncharacterized protein LOC120645239 isoform X2 [Panicum virgatum]|uniref:uncharacterized protein LOC120645239 isoform X2 n=1 Tax=Panicum virgatum TaxID=38727 RepID=UPI0019D5335C|nr:uncharacterized protein LOC120645239 isoform X2 [Panicum virgatum]